MKESDICTVELRKQALCTEFPFLACLYCFTSLLWLQSLFFLPYQVELHLKPIQSLLRHQKPLVFVLNSPQPLVWKIKTENLALGIKRTFHVSQPSEKPLNPTS